MVKGPKFSLTIERPETDLTVELLQSCVPLAFWKTLFLDGGHGRDRGAWKTATFKPYNFNAEGLPTNGGALHPLMKVREEFRNIFFEMGCVDALWSLRAAILTVT